MSRAPDFYQVHWLLFGLCVSLVAGIAVAHVSGRPETGYTAGLVTLGTLVGIANFWRARPRKPEIRFEAERSQLRVVLANKTGVIIFPRGHPSLVPEKGDHRLRPDPLNSSHETNAIHNGTSAQFVWQLSTIRDQFGDKPLWFEFTDAAGDVTRERVPPIQLGD